MKRFALVLFASALLTSCKNDLDVLDDYKETMVVYGILDAKDTAQYIKINKAYLGEGNALTMAQVFDSLNYDTAKLEVKLERWKNGVIVSTSIMKPDMSIPKDAGTFSNPNQILYKTTDAIFTDSEYKLTIKNKVTNNVVTATTPTISGYSISSPVNNATITYVKFTGSRYENTPFTVKWLSGENGKRYEVHVKFYYTEKNTLTNVLDSSYCIDWNVSTQDVVTTEAGQAMQATFFGKDFFSNLGSSIPVKSDVIRYPGKVEVYVYSATEDFATYMDINKPSTGIVQERPEYTNIQNGVGIFGYRTYAKSFFTKTYIYSGAVPTTSDPVATGLQYAHVSTTDPFDGLDELACGQFTSQLKFVYYRINSSTNQMDSLTTCPTVPK